MLPGQVHHSTEHRGVMFPAAQPGDELLKQADLAMYQAKDAGRNTVCFRSGDAGGGDRHAALATDLRQAAQKAVPDRLPAPGRRDGCMTGVEALLRWQHPQRAIVPPDEFIPVASPPSHPIGHWILSDCLLRSCARG